MNSYSSQAQILTFPLAHSSAEIWPRRPGEWLQDYGAMLVLDPETMSIEGMSENSDELIGVASDALGQPLVEASPDLEARLRRVLGAGAATHVALDEAWRGGRVACDVVAHVIDGRLLVEFLPEGREPTPDGETDLRGAVRAAAAARRAETFDDAMAIACDAMRALTGFDAAKICRFEPDGSGLIVAESRSNPTAPSEIGRRVPPKEFPPGARALLMRSPWRFVAAGDECRTTPLTMYDAAAPPVDLALALLRPPSEATVERLREAGAAAAFVTGLIHDGELWGVVICHGRKVRRPSIDSGELARQISDALMDRKDRAVRAETAKKLRQIRAAEALIMGDPAYRHDPRRAIAALLPQIQGVLDATGCALAFGDGVITSGRTPPPDVISGLRSFAEANAAGGVFRTTRLHAQWSAAAAHRETAAGALLTPACSSRACQIILFRGPVGEAGSAADGSRPWGEIDVAVAEGALADLLDIAAAESGVLDADPDREAAAARIVARVEAEAARGFTGKLVHDLRGPMRAITFALQMMKEDGFAETSVEEAYRIAESAGARLSALTGGLLEYSRLQGAEPDRSLLDMDGLLGDLRDAMSTRIAWSDVQVTFRPLPAITGDRDMIRRVFELLIDNAIAYRAKDRPPVVLVDGRQEDGEAVFRVTDNGIGVPPRHAEAIFRPMKRLHSRDEIEGAGLGLSICRAIVELHGGTLRLDPDFTQGARFVLSLPDSAPGACPN